MLNNILLKLGRVWFYFLAGIQVVIYFPFLVVILLLPKGYTILFWIARNLWARIILHGCGYYVKVKNIDKLNSEESSMIIANHASYMDIFLMLISSQFISEFTILGNFQIDNHKI